MSDIFLSYASKEREAARALASALERHGWSVWWDRRIPTGRDYAEVIESQLAAARCVIVLWSKTSVASEWVKTEAADAKDRHLLVPVFIEWVEKLPLEFRRIQAADLAGWTGDTAHAGFQTLVADLTGILGEPTARAGAAEEPPTRPDATRPVVDETGGDSPSLPSSPAPKTPSRTLLYRVGVAAVAVVLAFLVWAIVGRRNNEPNTNIINASPTATPRATPSPTPTPAVNDNVRANVNLNADRIKRLGSLLKQLNSSSEIERRGVTGRLKAEYSADPQAVEQALGLLDESRVGELSPQGLINVLFFLNNTQDDAWTFGSAERAVKAVDVLAKRPLGKQASDELSKFKARSDSLLRKTKAP